MREAREVVAERAEGEPPGDELGEDRAHLDSAGADTSAPGCWSYTHAGAITLHQCVNHVLIRFSFSILVNL